MSEEEVMPGIIIKRYIDDAVLYDAPTAETVKQAVEEAVRARANLYGANLVGANLDGADLYGASLYGASLVGANLYGASLVGANLYGANLDGASLVGANLYGASLYGASLVGASLVGANLDGASLYGANLDGANLDGADLDGANLYGANLYGASLDGASLVGANLYGANLYGANLDGATRLTTGETWDEYLRETLPALLTAGGRALAEVATAEHWDCHNWGNCPMHAAFGAADIGGVPILLRPRAEQFIKFFDSKLIPLPAIAVEVAE